MGLPAFHAAASEPSFLARVSLIDPRNLDADTADAITKLVEAPDAVFDANVAACESPAVVALARMLRSLLAQPRINGTPRGRGVWPKHQYVLRAACCVLRAACCVPCAVCCVLRVAFALLSFVSLPSDC